MKTHIPAQVRKWRAAAAALFVFTIAKAGVPDFTSTFVSVADYVDSNTDDLDDTTGINNAIAAAKAGGYKTLFFPVGTYVISGALDPLNSNFDMVSLMGENPRRTIIKLKAPGAFADAMLRTNGGSGEIGFGRIQDLQFQGNDSATAVRIRGTGGVRIVNCIFKQVAIGVEFSNDIGPGTFTDHSVAEDCSFESSCLTAIRYKRGSGDRAFHGTGVRNSLISRAPTNTAPSIRIGDGSEILDVYNAPLDFTVWTRNSSEVIKVASPDSAVQGEGTIRVENQATSAAPKLVAGPGKVFLAGAVTAWGDVGYGRLVQVDAIKRNADRSVSLSSKQRRVHLVPTKASTVTDIAATDLGSLVSVSVAHGTSDFRYLLYVSRKQGGQTGVLKTLATNFLDGDRDPEFLRPTFFVNGDGYLVIGNDRYATTSVEVKIVQYPVGGNLDSFWD